MKKDKLKAEDIKKRFKYQESFTAKQLYNFYTEEEPELNMGTFRWRVYYLKENGVIRSFKRGVYVLESNKIFKPNTTLKITRIYNQIKRNFPYTETLIWDTAWLHNYMIHQPVFSWIIVEVEKEAINSVYEMLKEKKGDVYVYYHKKEIDHTVPGNSIVIKPYLKETPVNKEKIVTPKIEKILVDLYSEKSLFITYQGLEKNNIFENIFGEYSINITTLYRYARHRAIKEKLKEYLLNNLSNYNKYLFKET